MVELRLTCYGTFILLRLEPGWCCCASQLWTTRSCSFRAIIAMTGWLRHRESAMCSAYQSWIT